LSEIFAFFSSTGKERPVWRKQGKEP